MNNKILTMKLMIKDADDGLKNIKGELVENVKIRNGEFLIKIEPILKYGETSIDGKTILNRAKKIGNLAGQAHAERLLEQEKSIPEEWKEFILIFAGTIWRDDGYRYITYLKWCWNWRWELKSEWLISNFHTFFYNLYLVRIF